MTTISRTDLVAISQGTQIEVQKGRQVQFRPHRVRNVELIIQGGCVIEGQERVLIVGDQGICQGIVLIRTTGEVIRPPPTVR